MDLQSEISYLTLTLGLNSIGFAPVERYNGAPEGHRPNDILPGARSVITFSYRLNNGALNHLPGTRNQYMVEFAAVNQQLAAAVHKITRLLEDKGFESIGIGPEADIGDYSRLKADFSHKHSAVLCGLGSFGVNNLLLVPKHKARVRLASVITCAEFKYSQPIVQDFCNKCLKCVAACPVGVLDNWSNQYMPDRGWTIAKEKCAHFMFVTGAGKRCGMCVAACPRD